MGAGLAAYALSFLLPTFDMGESRWVERTLNGFAAFCLTAWMVPHPITAHVATSIAALLLTLANVLMLWFGVFVTLGFPARPRGASRVVSAIAPAAGLLPLLNVFPTIGSTAHLLVGYFVWETSLILMTVAVFQQRADQNLAPDPAGVS